MQHQRLVAAEHIAEPIQIVLCGHAHRGHHFLALRRLIGRRGKGVLFRIRQQVGQIVVDCHIHRRHHFFTFTHRLRHLFRTKCAVRCSAAVLQLSKQVLHRIGSGPYLVHNRLFHIRLLLCIVFGPFVSTGSTNRRRRSPKNKNAGGKA